MERFNNRYRINTTRWRSWDYSANGLYFVTILTQQRENYFGKLVSRDVPMLQRSLIGDVAEQYWNDIPLHFPFVQLDAFSLLPNHLHGIIGIDKTFERLNTNEARDPDSSRALDTTWKPNRFGPQSRNLGSIIRGYKAGVKTYAIKNGIEFGWHPRFYDRLICDEEELEGVRTYILTNVAKHFHLGQR